MSTFFFDTSALKHRYTGTAISARISRAVSDKRHDVYVSELTVVELSSAFADRCTELSLGHREYDGMYRAFFRDVARKKVKVREITRRDLDNARHLLRFAKVVLKRHLKSADAIVAESCRELAYECGLQVTLYLCDEKLFKTLSAIDAYSAAVKLRYVHP